MSRSSGEGSLHEGEGESRAAVEPIAALIAVLAVGAALGLYVAALDDATPDRKRPTAETTLGPGRTGGDDGGVVEPERLHAVDEFRYAATVVIEAGGETWVVRSSDDAPPPAAQSTDSIAVAERPVTVEVKPGRNVRGTLRAVVYR